MSDPRPDEFVEFAKLLTENAPDGYDPWFFRVEAGSKAPDLSYGSWKEERARMTVQEAVKWMESGGNVGIAGRPDDPLVNVDIDDEDETTVGDLKPTLIARSRSRTGVHAWYFEAPGEDIPNIPTDDAGEVRANWQYVVAPGSYVEADPDDVPDGERANAGYYTVERDHAVTSLRLPELPRVFRDETEKDADEVSVEIDDDIDEPAADSDDDRRSALFDIDAVDVVRKEGGNTDTGDRWTALFHGSETGKNMSLSDEGLLHCWRHEVAHNGLQALVVLSDYSGGCQQVGSGHKRSGAGASCLGGEEGAHIWHAWKYAKENGYIPDDDPVPYSALLHLCRERDLCAVTELPDGPNESIPAFAYDGAIESIRNHDGLDPVRKKTDEISDGAATATDDIAADDTDGERAPEPDSGPNWDIVRERYENGGKPEGRLAAANALERTTDWMYVTNSERLWAYDADRGYYVPRGENFARRILERELRENYSSRDAKEVIGRLEARNQTQRHELNARSRNDPLLCVGNGVVNLRTGEVSDHSPEFKFTRGLSWDYKPDEADPAPVLEFLDDITEREADRDTILDHLAHGLMPGHPYRAFVVTYGPGSNGKTKLGDVLEGFVGEENAAAVELQDLTGDDSFATGGLPGAFVNIGDDISVGEVRDTSILKSVTGGGTIRANEKYEKKFNFENEAAMFFSANEPPRFNERTHAINDRVYPIEMPYRFVDNPEGANERQKEPGVAKRLVNDDAAMRGLLKLAIEHAQALIERNGEYSMPEGPTERREIYEAASDPIRRFALEYLEPAGGSAKVAKDDVYTVYTAMCEQEGERPTGEDTFKDVIGGMATLDTESGRSRALTPGDDRVYIWKYLRFGEGARDLMPPRLEARYFEDAEREADADGADDTGAFGSTPLDTAAETLTGYVTVTAEVVDVDTYGDGESATTKAVLTDESGAMDLVTWDESAAARLSDLEGETVALKNAEVGEHDGQRQLQVAPPTEIVQIQPGVGHTTGPTPDNDQQLTDTAAADGGTTDGGEKIADATGRVRQYLREQVDRNDPVRPGAVAEQTDLSPEQVEHAVDTLREDGTLQVADGDLRKT
jgi:P4 family phage/plasmid primase-like protien